MREYKLIRSNRKTLCLQIGEDLTLIARAPMRMSKAEIEAFIEQKSSWIDKNTELKRKQNEQYPTQLTSEETTALIEKAKTLLPQRIEYYSKLMGLAPTGVKITAAKKRFGSCNGKNSICFSLYLMQYPPEAIDYVIVHELAHIKYKSHGKDFYALIEKYMPDFRRREKMLKLPR